MATALQNLETRHKAVCAELAAMSATTAGGLPDAGGPDQIAHVAYRMSLLDERKQLKEAIAEEQGAFEVTSQARG